jgi:outer membrane protein assembly factor BamB
MAQGTTTEVPTDRPRRRRFWFPLAVLIVIALAAFVPRIWDGLELDPGPLMTIRMVCTWLGLAGVVALPVWFFVFSGYARMTKLAVLGLVLLAGGVVAGLVRRLELSGGWEPMLRWRWQADPAARFDEYLAQKPATDNLPPIDLTIGPLDFPRYRGTRGDGVVNDVRLATDWSTPPRLLWRHPCGGGYAGFAVAGNVAITLEQRRDQEAVVCYDRASGVERWVYAYPALFHRSEPMGGDGPRATPTIFDGAVYSLGATGILVCLDGASGRERWQVNILEDNGAANASWAMSGSPLIVDNCVIVNPGMDPARNAGMSLAAYDRKDGKKLWAANNRAAGYSSPTLATLAGRRQILLFDGVGLAGFDPGNGGELWSHPWETMLGMNIIQPLVVGADRVLISSELSNGAALLQIGRQGESFTVEEVWHNRNLASKFSSPVLHERHIFGLNYGILTCLDAATGARLWKDKRYGHGQILLADDVILVLSEKGEVALVATDPAGCRELARLAALDGKTWNTPALAGNQLFVRNHTEMACYELPLQTTGPIPKPSDPQ